MSTFDDRAEVLLHRRAADRSGRGRSAAGQRGAALLTAMVIVTLIATLAAAMIWQQWRSIQIEAAERASAQSRWILIGAIDWARLILREDARAGGGDHLGEPWAVPLAEAKLSTFLAADRDNTDEGPEAFLSGTISDAQARYNLTNLALGSKPQTEIKTLQRLLESAGGDSSQARVISQKMRAALPGSARSAPQRPTEGETQPPEQPPEPTGDIAAPLSPQRVEQLAWLGVDAATIARLRPYVVILPAASRVNLNTASREVISAVLDTDLSTADRIVQMRQGSPLRDVQQALTLLPGGGIGATGTSGNAGAGAPNPGAGAADASRVSVDSGYFEVQARLRLDDRIIEERALIERRDRDTTVIRRERIAALSPAGS
jgi:general secretion pathway protein K